MSTQPDTDLTKSAHTPGPWRAVPSSHVRGWRIFSAGKTARFVATVQVGERATTEQIAADAHLIAAAPELLEAMKEAVYRWSVEREDYVTDSAYIKSGVAYERMVSAIAKAEGR